MNVNEWLGEDNVLGQDIFTKKYQHNGETFDEWLDRVSNGNEKIKQLIIEKKFIFGGRILSNRGVNDSKTSLSNCYVLASPEDTIESIFDRASKMARTYSMGGGVGIDLSKLRPNGSKVSNAAKKSTGPVSFMDVYSQVTGTISQNGRRGALMISLDINHPDAEEFIDCKTDLNRVNYANISVRVNDEFMKAAENNEDYILRWPCDIDVNKHEIEAIDEYDKLVLVETQCGPVYLKKVNARKIFNKLVKNNWNYAEPGILFWNRIESYNMVSNDDRFKYECTNPCGELPLPAYGACCLGSINLSEFVINPFTENAYIDYPSLERTVHYVVDEMNVVLDEGLERHPLPEQKECARIWRPIGVGTMGLADMLIKLGICYGDRDSLDVINMVYRTIAVESVKASLELAKKQGAFPMWSKDLVESSFIKALILPQEILDDIKKNGLRNCQLLTCAPTGTIGTMLETSTGVEPNFMFKYFRKTVSLNDKEQYYEVDAKIVKEYRAATNDGNAVLPKYFVTSEDIEPEKRVVVQSALQSWIDNSISSTVNLKKEATVEDVYDIYMNAWKQHLKGITIYRSGCKREGILVTEKKENTLTPAKAPKRPKELPADLYTVKVKGETFIVLIGLLDGKPYEVFTFRPNIDINVNNHKGVIVKKSKMHYMFKSDTITINELELANDNIEEKAATLYSSMLLRHGVDIKYIIKTAKKVNNNITSFSSAMCRVLSKYIPDEVLDEKCPECGGNLVRTGGCIQCQSCGWSKCG